MLQQINPIHNLTTCFFKIHFTVGFSDTSKLNKWVFQLNCSLFLSTRTKATCPVQPTLLDFMILDTNRILWGIGPPYYKVRPCVVLWVLSLSVSLSLFDIFHSASCSPVTLVNDLSVGLKRVRLKTYTISLKRFCLDHSCITPKNAQ
jgi:hypothetical protein